MIGSEVVQNPMPISMEESAVDASRVESEVSNQPASFNKATQYVKAGMQAQASGDAQALAKVNENILSDPEMHQLAHKNGKSLLSGDYSTLGSKDATRVREEESSAVGVPKNEVYRRATDALRRVQMAKNDQERSEAYAVLSADQDVNDFFKTHSVDTGDVSGDVSSQIENGQINGQEAEDPKKRAEWEKTKNEVMRITDKLGKGLDEGIIETVVAFQVLGINTFQSCEGHVDHESESPSPYIDVATPGLEKDGKKVDKMYKIANAIRRPTYLRAAFNNLTGKAVSKDEIYHLEVQAQEMNEQLREKNAPEVQKVQGLLNEFYQDRSVAEDTRLFIDQYFIHGEGRLRPTGADELEQQIKSGSVNLEERKRKLETYQSEVAAFTTFLRNKFLKKRK